MMTRTLLASLVLTHISTAGHPPNIILIMFDDLGYGDTGYQGSPHAHTPHIDEMAASSLVFNRFYAQSPVCSPTRGSALTGRHPHRYGIYRSNIGHLPENEPNLADLLRARGYRTGMFGKWHLGTLTTEIREANRARTGDNTHFAPPWQRGFDVCFATESKVPTYNPTVRPRDFTNHPGSLGRWWHPDIDPDNIMHYGTRYWNEKGGEVTENLDGPDAKVVMDRAIPFIRQAAESNTPFFAVIWLHEPHLPVVGGVEDLERYAHLTPYQQHYFACITAADREIGRLRATLRELGVAQDTMIWLSSDNGPEGDATAPGSAATLRGRKRSLYEGGIRVPGLLEWPARIAGKRETDMPAVTTDHLPTLADLLDLPLPEGLPFDGVSLMPLIDGKAEERPRPIPFQFSGRIALIDNRYKIINATARGNHIAEPPHDWELYDLIEDPSETTNIAEQHPDIVRQMETLLMDWNASLKE